MANKLLSTLTTTIKTLYTKNPWKGRFILTLFILTLILIIIRAALPQTIIYSATSWLKQQGIESTIEDININIFGGTVSLINAMGSKDSNILFNAGLVDIHWRWVPLSDKTIEVTKVVLDRFSVNIEQYTDEIVIGGVHITAAQNSDKEIKKPSNNDSKPWAASLGEIIFTNLNICYLQHAEAHEKATQNSKVLDYCANLKQLSWEGTISYAVDPLLSINSGLPLSSTGDFKLDGLTITDNKLQKKLISSTSNILRNVVISGTNNILIKSISMNGFSALQRDDNKHTDTFRFQQLVISNIKLLNLDSLSIDDINFNKPGLFLVKQKPSAWEYQQWIPALPEKTAIANKQINKKGGDSFNTSIKNITISNADNCYLEESNSMHYCFTFNKFDWQGRLDVKSANSASSDLDLKANGHLSFLQPNVQNHTIKRTLLYFESLELADLNINGIDDFSLTNLKLDKLSALQRSKETNDHTASMGSLSINDIKYSQNNISINTINLDDIAANISKNKDGTWEHAKWSHGKSTENKSDTAPATSTTDKKPIAISLNKLIIATDKELLFTDNSTDPATKTGLQNLSFDLSNLNSAQADKNSLFKLVCQNNTT